MTKTSFRPTSALLALLLCGSAVVGQGEALAKAPKPAAAPHRDLAQEDKNLALVLTFSEAVFNQGDFSVAEKLLAPDYIQHNPRFATGRDAFIAAFKGVRAAHPGLHSDIVRSGTSGDLVFTHVRVSDGSGKGDMAIVNIFRVSGGKIVEHWDVVQPVPETAANTNTMF